MPNGILFWFEHLQCVSFDAYNYAKDYMNKASAAQKETIKTDEYKKADYTSKQDMLSKARSKAKKEAVSNFLSKNNK